MPNYTLYATPEKYNPLSFLEMWTPVLAATEYHLAIADLYDDLEMKASTLEKLADSAIDQPLYQLYKAYAEQLRQVANDLATQGAVGSRATLVRSDLSKVRKDYAGQIQPIMDAYAARQKQVEEYDKAYAKDPFTQFSINPREVGLGEYMSGSPTVYQVSGTDVFNRGVAAGKQISSNLIKLKDRYGTKFAQFFREDGSISVDTMQAMADQGDKDAQAVINALTETSSQMQSSSDYNYLTLEGKDKIDSSWWQGVNTGWYHNLDKDIRNMPDEGGSGVIPEIATLNEITDTLPVVTTNELDDAFSNMDTSWGGDVLTNVIAEGQLGFAPDIIRKGNDGTYYLDEAELNDIVSEDLNDSKVTMEDVILNGVTAVPTLVSRTPKTVAPMGDAPSYLKGMPLGAYLLVGQDGKSIYITEAAKHKLDNVMEILKGTNPSAYEKLNSQDPKVRQSVNVKLALQTAIKNYTDGNYDKGLIQHKVRFTDNQTLESVGNALQTALQLNLIYEYGLDNNLKTYSKGKQIKDIDFNKEKPITAHWLGGDDKFIALTLLNTDNKKLRLIVIPATVVSDLLGEALKENNRLQVLLNSFKNLKINGVKVGEFRAPDKSKPTSEWTLLEKLYFKIDLMGGIQNATEDKFTKAEWKLLNDYVRVNNASAAAYTGFTGALIGNAAVGALAQNAKVNGSGVVKP